LRWAFAGHPPALRLDTGEELVAPKQGVPLGVYPDVECVEGSRQARAGEGVFFTPMVSPRHAKAGSCSASTPSATNSGKAPKSPKPANGGGQGRFGELHDAWDPRQLVCVDAAVNLRDDEEVPKLDLPHSQQDITMLHVGATAS